MNISSVYSYLKRGERNDTGGKNDTCCDLYCLYVNVSTFVACSINISSVYSYLKGGERNVKLIYNKKGISDIFNKQYMWITLGGKIHLYILFYTSCGS